MKNIAIYKGTIQIRFVSAEKLGTRIILAKNGSNKRLQFLIKGGVERVKEVLEQWNKTERTQS